MGLSDSPLIEKVVFVEGVPRSGTSVTASLLAVHPEIAGVVNESHLFDRGVDRLFANHSGGEFLTGYLTTAELTDLVRDLCDGVLVAMRNHVKPGAQLIAEKTPAPPGRAAVVLRQKLNVYPDARYLHVVRERATVVESLLQMPWNDRDRRGTERWYDEAIESIRAICGGGRYLEIEHSALAADPETVMGQVFEWIGTSFDSETRERVTATARERLTTSPGNAGTPIHAGSRQLRRPRRLGRLRAALAERRRRRQAPERRLLDALRDRNATLLESLTAEELTVELRTGAGDRQAGGDEARRLLLDLATTIFSASIGVQGAYGGGDATPVLMLAAIRPDGSRTDIALGCEVRHGLIRRIGIVSAGDPSGRTPTVWQPAGSQGVSE